MRYGSDFAMKLVYVPVGEDEQPLIYKGRLGANGFDSSSFLKDAEITHGIKLAKKSHTYEGLGEGEVSDRNPLVIAIRVKENRLARDPSQKAPMMRFRYNTRAETDEFLRELGSEFSPAYMMRVLEKIRQNIRYGQEAEDLLDDIIRSRSGICRDFACLLDYSVNKMGGRSDTARGRAVNLLVRGQPVFRSIAEGAYGFHGWNEVHYDGVWNLVDPTIYTNSPEDVKGRAINETREIYFLEPPAFFIDFVDSPRPAITAKLVACEITN